MGIRIPATVTQPVLLRVWFSSPVTAGTHVWCDEMALVEGRQLYAGGPYVAVFSTAASPAAADAWSVSVTNNRAGSWQTWFNRMFDMANLGLLLPTTGTTNVPDALIA
jgi:hypothetical protein